MSSRHLQMSSGPEATKFMVLHFAWPQPVHLGWIRKLKKKLKFWQWKNLFFLQSLQTRIRISEGRGGVGGLWWTGIAWLCLHHWHIFLRFHPTLDQIYEYFSQRCVFASKLIDQSMFCFDFSKQRCQGSWIESWLRVQVGGHSSISAFRMAITRASQERRDDGLFTFGQCSRGWGAQNGGHGGLVCLSGLCSESGSTRFHVCQQGPRQHHSSA